MTPIVENQVEKKLEHEMEVVRKILHDKVPYASDVRQNGTLKSCRVSSISSIIANI